MKSWKKNRNYRFSVSVFYPTGIKDNDSLQVLETLREKYSEVRDVRVGRYYELLVHTSRAFVARGLVKEIAEVVLKRTAIEQVRITAL